MIKDGGLSFETHLKIEFLQPNNGSKKMLGKICADGISPSRGLWHKAEFEQINDLELKAIKIGIYTYCKNKDFLHVRVKCDNATAISYVNNMGDMKSQTCNNIACRIWDFCTKTQLWVSAVHIQGTINIEADKQSRVMKDATEWKFNLALFHKIVEKFGKPDIDLFATRINKQLDRCVLASRTRDNGCQCLPSYLE